MMDAALSETAGTSTDMAPASEPAQSPKKDTLDGKANGNAGDPDKVCIDII
jgi:hypothetical protein